MKITVNEFRKLVRKSMISEKRGEMNRDEIFGMIEYLPAEQAFHDRWGHPLPSSPASMQDRDVRDWLESNRTESIQVRGRKMSPKNFMKFLEFMRTGNKPAAQGKVIPIVRGKPVPGGRPLSEE